MGAESDLSKSFELENIATVKDEGGLEHLFENLLIIEGFEFIPLGHDREGVAPSQASSAEEAMCTKG